MRLSFGSGGGGWSAGGRYPTVPVGAAVSVVEDRDPGAVRSRATMHPGDVAAMPADIRHQGYAPKRSMLLVWENADPACPG